jgi:putative transcriptional regulator
MIRFRVMELLANKQFEEDRVITITEMAAATEISRVTLSKIVNQRGYVTGTDNLDRLCRYFGCAISDLIEYIPDPKLPRPKSARVGQLP